MASDKKHKKFCKLVKAYIKDETKAIKEYELLISLAPSPIKNRLNRIKNDERNHAKILKSLKLKYC